MRPMLTQVTPLAGAVTTAWDTECYRLTRPMIPLTLRLSLMTPPLTMSCKVQLSYLITVPLTSIFTATYLTVEPTAQPLEPLMNLSPRSRRS